LSMRSGVEGSSTMEAGSDNTLRGEEGLEVVRA
jgi:hypothetical protein